MQSLHMTHLFSRSVRGTENWIEPISGNRCHRPVSPFGGWTSTWVAFCNIFKRDAALNDILNRPRQRGLCSRSPVLKSADLNRWDQYQIWRPRGHASSLAIFLDIPRGFQPVHNSFQRHPKVPKNERVSSRTSWNRTAQKCLVKVKWLNLYVFICFCVTSEMTWLSNVKNDFETDKRFSGVLLHRVGKS